MNGIIFEEKGYFSDYIKKTRIKILKHPQGKNVSIGILIKDCHWLIFSNITVYDYNGYGPDYYNSIKSIIEDNSKYFNYEIIRIPIEIFFNYIKKNKSSDKLEYFVNKKNIEHLSSEIGKFRGRYFESLVFKWLIYSNGNNNTIYWDENVQNEQIDVYKIENKKKIVKFYECKTDLHKNTLLKYLKRIKLKKKAMEKEFPDYEVCPCLCIYEDNSKNIKKIIESKSSKLEVIHNFKQKIIENPRIFGKSERIIKLIEFDVKYFF